MNKQVDAAHYDWSKYVHKKRWLSIWHQLDEVLAHNPETVLELGPGPGVFKALAETFGVNIKTLDIDPELNPDYIGSVLAMPFEDESYSVVCAFQMLEHLPYESSLIAFSEMVRVARNNVVISLPDASPVYRLWFHVPRWGEFTYHIPYFWRSPQPHVFDGEHYWEINKKDYALSRILEDFSVIVGSKFSIEKTYRVQENPYHRFFVFSRQPRV
ncbi:class I SAM-dependent methyltransferase [Pelodictyon luteolum]|uniref:Uncharacterized protein n=1 Tax=Chlorobium luteolum (strain DSM 273 / BCRC 81028 / 2530) TaxID=319225 RepID=Q3B1R6_CHLL3|nr:class I SAM-dependent methyltransferase [Pelodictyon luteolum]ABB24715.1 hypothetical protein Plut_1867 [Pelodictyon luteolum DSM 273]